jgi:hypothetical protein
MEALHAMRSVVTDARPSTRIVYWFDRNDYDAIRQLFADDLQLSESFDQWAEAEKQTREMEARGLVPRKTVINPEEFAAYCAARGLDKNVETLRAFAVIVDRQNYACGV